MNRKTWPDHFFTILFVVMMTIGYSQWVSGYAPSDSDSGNPPVVSGKITGDELVIIYQIPENRHQVILEDFHFMTVEVDSVPGIVFGDTKYPAGDKDEDGNTVYYGETRLIKKIVRINDSYPLPDSIQVEAGYQFCTEEGMCLAPETIRFKVALTGMAVSSGPTGETGKKSVSLPVILTNLFFAFLGGLILNVMPCVLPVLSIKVMSIVHSAHDDRKEILKGSLVYTAGVLTSFLIMGGVVAGLKIAGQSVGWGFQFQNISFVIFLLALIWVFGLAMFDVFIIQIPGAQTATQASSKGGHWGSFITGIFAVLLATPCTAPMLGAALGWTFSQPPWMIVTSFLIIGLGLASPFMIIGFFPGFIKLIPKPGPWMNTFKEIMGFLLMATVVYLLRVAYFLVESHMIQILWFLLILAFSCWIIGRFGAVYRSKRTRVTAVLLAMALSISAGFYFLKFEENRPVLSSQESVTGVHDPHHPDWLVFNPELLEKFIAENQPVFIDFAAEWCLTCKANEGTVLFSSDIQNAFRSRHVRLMRGDFTRKNPLIQVWLTKFGRAGVPLYVLYRPGEEEPVVLPEVITKEMILRELDKIRQDRP